MAVKGSAQKSEFYDYFIFIYNIYIFLIIKCYNAVLAPEVNYNKNNK